MGKIIFSIRVPAFFVSPGERSAGALPAGGRAESPRASLRAARGIPGRAILLLPSSWPNAVLPFSRILNALLALLIPLVLWFFKWVCDHKELIDCQVTLPSYFCRCHLGLAQWY